MKTAESKQKSYVVTSGTNVNHNSITPLLINGSTQTPALGAFDDQRIGDKVNTTGYKMRMIFQQAPDRPNVTWKLWIMKVPKGVSYTYSSFFFAISNNVLLDDTNTDYVKVLATKIYKPYTGRMENSTDSFTFARKLWVPYRRVLNFGPANGAQTHDDGDIYALVTAYDASGTLLTDVLGSVQMWCSLYYRDP